MKSILSFFKKNNTAESSDPQKTEQAYECLVRLKIQQFRYEAWQKHKANASRDFTSLFCASREDFLTTEDGIEKSALEQTKNAAQCEILNEAINNDRN